MSSNVNECKAKILLTFYNLLLVFGGGVSYNEIVGVKVVCLMELFYNVVRKEGYHGKDI